LYSLNALLFLLGNLYIRELTTVNIVSIQWELGNGEVAMGDSVQTAYPVTGDYTAGIPRRQLLLDQHVTACLADCDTVQSGGLSDQWFSLELF